MWSEAGDAANFLMMVALVSTAEPSECCCREGDGKGKGQSPLPMPLRLGAVAESPALGGTAVRRPL